MSKPSPKHPLSERERLGIEGLRQVTFPVASWDKRFFRDVLLPSLTTGELGDKSEPQLWRIFVRYRRQIDVLSKEELLTYAAVRSAPDFRRQRASARAQEEREKYAESIKAATPK